MESTPRSRSWDLPNLSHHNIWNRKKSTLHCAQFPASLFERSETLFWTIGNVSSVVPLVCLSRRQNRFSIQFRWTTKQSELSHRAYMVELSDWNNKPAMSEWCYIHASRLAEFVKMVDLASFTQVKVGWLPPPPPGKPVLEWENAPRQSASPCTNTLRSSWQSASSYLGQNSTLSRSNSSFLSLLEDCILFNNGVAFLLWREAFSLWGEAFLLLRNTGRHFYSEERHFHSEGRYFYSEKYREAFPLWGEAFLLWETQGGISKAFSLWRVKITLLRVKMPLLRVKMPPCISQSENFSPQSRKWNTPNESSAWLHSARALRYVQFALPSSEGLSVHFTVSAARLLRCLLYRGVAARVLTLAALDGDGTYSACKHSSLFSVQTDSNHAGWMSCSWFFSWLRGQLRFCAALLKQSLVVHRVRVHLPLVWQAWTQRTCQQQQLSHNRGVQLHCGWKHSLRSIVSECHLCF